MNKDYVYRHYSAGVFVGILSPTSEFSIVKEVNTLGSQLMLELPVAFESTVSTISADRLTDENSDFIIDENSDNILLSFDYVIDSIPNVADRIEVTEYSDENPNGVVVFDGLVTKWESGYSTNTTTVYAMSYGVQLDNYIVQILPGETVAEQPLYTGEYTVFGSAGKVPGPYDRLTAVSQTFTLGSTTEITSVFLYLKKDTGGGGGALSATIAIIEGSPSSPGSTLGSATVSVSTTDLGLTEFQFLSSISLSASVEYHIRITSPYGSNASETNLLFVAYNSAGGYAGGQVYLSNETSGITTPGTDLYFQLVSSTGGIGNQFNSYDPSQIVRELLDNAIALGANVTYTEDSIRDTGATVSYTFKFATYYDALKKCVELSPANWYFYIDPGTNVVYFDKKSTSPDHVLINGRHISDMVIGRSLEDVTNIVYFVGGDDGTGSNLLASNSSTSSLAKYGSWLEIVTDNRVSTEATANIIVDGKLNEKSEARFYVGSVRVPSSTYDTTLYRPGQSVGYNNFNDVVNSLVLQILSVALKSDEAILKLEVSPPQTAKRVEDIRRNLLMQQTENNPDL